MESPEGFIFKAGDTVVNRQEIIEELDRALDAGEITYRDAAEVVEFLDLLEYAYSQGVRISNN